MAGKDRMSKENGVTKERKSKKKRNIVLCAAALVLVIAAAVGARAVYRILKQPESMFDNAVSTPVPEQTPLAPVFELPTEHAPEQTEQTSLVPTQAPANTDIPEKKGILNILLTGIDAYESGKTSSGTMPHTDAMMVIAINFDQNIVDLITLPRDTLTTAPGHSGFYKLNGIFNVGLNGKFKTSGKAGDLADGFYLTCRAAEQWLGGISIPYYYGLDFQAVADIVDAIGGIDYDVDQAFTSQSGKRHYGLGMHHLDGDAVMGYLRIRWGADGLDSSRTARQRRMMVAIFKKLKSEGKLSQIPALISAANSGIYTNTTLAQTTALVNYAANLDADRIRTRSMYGEIGDIEYEWRFVYVDQQNRIDLIKEVYDIDAEPVGISTRQYERWLYKIGFVTIKRLHQIEKVLTLVQEKKNAGETFTEEQISQYGECYIDYMNLYKAYEACSDELADIYATTPWREKKKNQSKWTDEQKQRDKELTQREKEIYEQLVGLSDTARTSLNELAKSIGYRKIAWSLSDAWYKDPDINEVYVNFG